MNRIFMRLPHLTVIVASLLASCADGKKSRKKNDASSGAMDVVPSSFRATADEPRALALINEDLNSIQLKLGSGTKLGLTSSDHKELSQAVSSFMVKHLESLSDDSLALNSKSSIDFSKFLRAEPGDACGRRIDSINSSYESTTKGIQSLLLAVKSFSENKGESASIIKVLPIEKTQADSFAYQILIPNSGASGSAIDVTLRGGANETAEYALDIAAKLNIVAPTSSQSAGLADVKLKVFGNKSTKLLRIGTDLNIDMQSSVTAAGVKEPAKVLLSLVGRSDLDLASIPKQTASISGSTSLLSANADYSGDFEVALSGEKPNSDTLKTYHNIKFAAKMSDQKGELKQFDFDDEKNNVYERSIGADGLTYCSVDGVKKAIQVAKPAVEPKVPPAKPVADKIAEPKPLPDALPEPKPLPETLPEPKPEPLPDAKSDPS